MESQLEHAAVVSGNHVFNVDVGVFSSMLFQNLKGLLNQVPHVLVLPLSEVHFVSQVHFELIQKPRFIIKEWEQYISCV